MTDTRHGGLLRRPHGDDGADISGAAPGSVARGTMSPAKSRNGTDRQRLEIEARARPKEGAGLLPDLASLPQFLG